MGMEATVRGGFDNLTFFQGGDFGNIVNLGQGGLF